jgi:hypothetical protein
MALPAAISLSLAVQSELNLFPHDSTPDSVLSLSRFHAPSTIAL